MKLGLPPITMILVVVLILAMVLAMVPVMVLVVVVILAAVLVMICAGVILAIILFMVLAVVLVMVLTVVLAEVLAIYRRRWYEAAATEDVGAGHCQSGLRKVSPDQASLGEGSGRTREKVPFEVRSRHCRGLGGPPVHVARLSAVGHDHR